MSDHYFSANPDSKAELRSIEVSLKGHSFCFYTSTGVFSKQGLDYGSRLLMESVLLPLQGAVLDLGCGYGPVGIACATMAPQCFITMVDINERAVELAKQNAERNGVAKRVQVMQSDGCSAVEGQQFAAILTNPPIRTGKEVIYNLFRQARDHLTPEGILWIVIRKQQGAVSAIAELERLGLEVQVETRKKGYWILSAKKY
ncbi:class I SAM-dependent methyltransferase [Mechercharimyces sp. CAU 1602]|uniref:class I SAM-dependent methyltransferase n=1 Tax=Mechercharimyces sp. CAU 1602 TaxID=2973933 RepID=UPI00216116DB|nr:class I SAM-dependent methyltransferase [Mechercharimyces sp. CAU 1602]MCS1352525.1 class I SAM-dependent methyltransferase [Mechercharimyces sp. CAU 1602]